MVASDLSWRAVDIATAYTLRWLTEVFFEDRELHEGWGRFAPQFDEEGSSKSLTLSLLLDHALLLHPQQRVRIENNLPACTVGSLQQHSRMDALIEGIGRRPEQRTTLYGTPSEARIEQSYQAVPLEALRFQSAREYRAGR